MSLTPRRHRNSTRLQLIKARERIGLTRPQLAKKMGQARSYIYKVEVGDNNPGVATILRWLAVLGPEASVELFEPHPLLEQWTGVLGKKVRRSIAQQLVA
jgi:transcriptional regulator with XRE-family HTH domain